MIIDVKKLLREGKTTCTFSFKTEMDDECITLPDAKFDGDVTVTGEAEINGKDVYIDAEVSYTVIGECSRCLDKATANVVEPFSAKFVEQNPEEDDYTYKHGEVDLSEAVRDTVLYSMPYAIYCKPDCKGLCPVCGKNLNEGECEHSQKN